MNRSLSIRSWLEPFPSTKGVAVIFDIFRCSTTIHCLKHLAVGPLYVAPSLLEAERNPQTSGWRLFSELPEQIPCLKRFDNSPLQALESSCDTGIPALVATTSGTPAMFAARGFERVYVGSLVNFSALVKSLCAYDGPITLIPAARPEWDHVEDEIVCQAVATALEGFTDIPDFVRQCAENAKERITTSHRPEHLARKLPTGREDVKLSLEIDRFPHQLLSLAFENGPLAEVIQENPCATG